MVQILENVLSTDEVESTFYMLKPEGGEVQYGQYYALTDNSSLVRLPRLMAFQASINESGDYPWYRCTMSSVPQNKIVYQSWTPTVEKIKLEIEKRTNRKWNLAHIIYYKNGEESMGMHSDTMLDLEPGSDIAVVSLGSTRQLDLIKKKTSTSDGPEEIKLDLPGNSLFLLDEETNRHYVHGIRKQKKNQVQDRVAIVFRNVITFKAENDILYGSGSVYATKQEIIQRRRNFWILKLVFSLLLAVVAFWLRPLSNLGWSMLVIGGIYWFSISLIIDRIDRAIHNHLKTKENKRLQNLCQKKNFQIWDQLDMRKFLKYD